MQISILGTDGAYLANNGSNAISILGPDGNLLPNDGTNFVCVTGSDGAYQPNDGTVEAFSILGTDGALLPYVEGNSFSVLDENGALAIPVTDNLISPLLWGGAQGAWYDPSDLSTMFQLSYGDTAVTATGQSVGLILDKSKGLALGPDIAPALPAMTAINASLSQVGDELTITCLVDGVYGVADNALVLTSGSGYQFTMDVVANSAAKNISWDIGGVSGASGSTVGINTRIVSRTISASQFNIYVIGGVAGETFTISGLSLRTLAGNHAYQTTAASRPVYRNVAGRQYLEFDGVDDYLRSTFTIAQPIDRISALQQVTWTNGDQIFGGVTANAGVLLQQTPTPNLNLYSGGFGGANSGLAINTNGVVSERHQGASSRLAINSGAYATGNAGTTLPGGITIGHSNTPGAYANFNLYQLVMRGSTTAMTDAEIRLSRLLCAAKAGVTL